MDRKFKFQKLAFKPKQVGIDIRGGYCSNVRKSSQAYKLGVRTGWRIVNIDGERVPKEDKEIASLIRSCIDADDEFPITFRLPPKSTCAGYRCGDVVEALDSTGRQWNKCLIIDIVDEKFSIVYLHNAVRSKKFQAMLRRVNKRDDDDDDDGDWGEDDDELEGKVKPSKGKKKNKKRGKRKLDRDAVEVDASMKKLLKAAIGKEAKTEAKEMKKEYARVAAACQDPDKCDQVIVYLEEKLQNSKRPSIVLKALLLTTYLMAYGDEDTCSMVKKELADAVEEACELEIHAKTAAGKAAVSDIKTRVGPAARQLFQNSSILAQARSTAQKTTQAQLKLAPPPEEAASPTFSGPALAGPPQPAQANPQQAASSDPFANLRNLTADVNTTPAPQPQPVNNGIDLGALFSNDEPQQPQQQQVQNPNFLASGFANMNFGGQQPVQQPVTQSVHQQAQVPNNLWSNGLVDLGLGNNPSKPQPKEQKITLQQMQGEEVDLFSF